MIRSGLLWKLYGGYVLLILLTTATVGLLVSYRVEWDTGAEIEASLRAKATMLRALAQASMDDGRLQMEIDKLGEQTSTRLTVVDAEGRVLADSDEAPARMDNHGTRPEILDATQKGIGQATRFSNTVQSEMMYLALPIRDADRLWGHVRAALPTTVVDRRLSRLRGIVLLGAAIAALLALALGFVVARRITAPLSSMTQGAEAIAAGDYHRRVGGASGDEIGKLARAFDEMAAQLEGRVGTITRDRNKLLAILGGMIEGVVAVDRDGRVVHMNAVAGEILGANPTASSGRPIWEVTRIVEIAETLGRAVEGSGELAQEVQLVRPDTEQTIETYASPLRDGDGNLAGAVMVLHDVSELRRLETVRSEFVANASHELKTPITAIRGLVDTLVDDQEIEPETRKRFLEKVRRQSERLSSLVSDLLTLSRLESERALVKRVVDLRDAVTDSVRAMGGRAEHKGLEVSCAVPDEPVTVLSDLETVREIADNLLDNAIKYTTAPGRVEVQLRTEECWAILEVRDDGIGIEPVEQARIFERFYRVDRARSRELGGTGLGLAIVKHAAVSLGGEVVVESAPGKGSVFTARLPLASGAGEYPAVGA